MGVAPRKPKPHNLLNLRETLTHERPCDAFACQPVACSGGGGIFGPDYFRSHVRHLHPDPLHRGGVRGLSGRSRVPGWRAAPVHDGGRLPHHRGRRLYVPPSRLSLRRCGGSEEAASRPLRCDPLHPGPVDLDGDGVLRWRYRHPELHEQGYGHLGFQAGDRPWQSAQGASDRGPGCGTQRTVQPVGRAGASGWLHRFGRRWQCVGDHPVGQLAPQRDAPGGDGKPGKGRQQSCPRRTVARSDAWHRRFGERSGEDDTRVRRRPLRVQRKPEPASGAFCPTGGEHACCEAFGHRGSLHRVWVWQLPARGAEKCGDRPGACIRDQCAGSNPEAGRRQGGAATGRELLDGGCLRRPVQQHLAQHGDGVRYRPLRGLRSAAVPLPEDLHHRLASAAGGAGGSLIQSRCFDPSQDRASGAALE